MAQEPPKGAILQRDNESYAIVPRIPAGLLTPQKLRKLADVVEKYEIPLIKMTSGHRIALIGIKEDQIENIYEDLGMDPGKATELCLHYVQACPGTEVCKFGVQDSLGLGQKIEEMLTGRDLPAKFKIGVSGCPFSCAENQVRDLGLMAKKNGWTISVGGHSGRQARVADVIAEDLSEQEVIDMTNKIVDYYAENAKKRERTCKFIERIGVEEFKNQIIN